MISDQFLTTLSPWGTSWQLFLFMKESSSLVIALVGWRYLKPWSIFRLSFSVAVFLTALMPGPALNISTLNQEVLPQDPHFYFFIIII